MKLAYVPNALYLHKCSKYELFMEINSYISLYRLGMEEKTKILLQNVKDCPVLKSYKCIFSLLNVGALINYINIVHTLSPKVNDFFCYFDSYIGSCVCKEQGFIQVTSYRESYKNKGNRNLSQSSRKVRGKKKKCFKQK